MVEQLKFSFDIISELIFQIMSLCNCMLIPWESNPALFYKSESPGCTAF